MTSWREVEATTLAGAHAIGSVDLEVEFFDLLCALGKIVNLSIPCSSGCMNGLTWCGRRECLPRITVVVGGKEEVTLESWTTRVSLLHTAPLSEMIMVTIIMGLRNPFLFSLQDESLEVYKQSAWCKVRLLPSILSGDELQALCLSLADLCVYKRNVRRIRALACQQQWGVWNAEDQITFSAPLGAARFKAYSGSDLLFVICVVMSSLTSVHYSTIPVCLQTDLRELWTFSTEGKPCFMHAHRDPNFRIPDLDYASPSSRLKRGVTWWLQEKIYHTTQTKIRLEVLTLKEAGMRLGSATIAQSSGGVLLPKVHGNRRTKANVILAFEKLMGREEALETGRAFNIPLEGTEEW